MTDLSKQAAIAAEIRDALKAKGQLSSGELNAFCGSALDSTDVCRVLYDMHKTGLVAIADQRAIGGKGKPVKFYQWIGQDTGAIKASHRKPKESPVAESIEDEPASAKSPVCTVSDEPKATTAMGEATQPESPAPAPSPTEPKRHPFLRDRTDPTELALADLLDQADEALLALADSLLSDHPVWSRLRQLASDAHDTLCDYRLLRSLEAS